MGKEYDIDDSQLGGETPASHLVQVPEAGVCPECTGAGITGEGDVCPLCQGTGRANARVGGG